MYASDGIRMCLSALESVTQALRNAPDRYAGRVNPDNFEVGRRGLQALVCEVGELAREAIEKVAQTPTAL